MSEIDLSRDFAAWDRLRRPVWVFDPVTFRGLYANPPALDYWDATSREELLARDFSNLSQSVRTRVERLAQATADGQSVSERWTFYPRGQPVTVQAMISALHLGDGRNALLFEAVAIDVQEGERRAVEALRHTSSLVTLFDRQGKALFANPAAFAAYGEGEAGFIDRFSDPAHGAEALARVLAGEVLAEFSQMRSAEGERYHHLDARSVLDPVTGQVSVLLSERDVTAQVEAERALTAAQEQAEVAVAKQRFLSNMSHELRTPLNHVIGFASLLGRSRLDAAQGEHVGRIATAGQALLTIVNDVITLSELDDGEVIPSPAPFDPLEALQRAVRSVEAQAAAKGLTLEVRAPPGEPPWVVGDEALLCKALGGYLSNAVRFTERGGVVVELGLSPAPAGRAVMEVSVADSGPGVTPEVQARLFQRFSPGDDSRTKQSGGSGLGLAITKELAALMGGEVGVESPPGGGARFWLRLELPLEDAGAAPVSGAAAETQGDPAGDEGALTILYADDNESNRMLVKAVLETQGHRCDTVDDGDQAVRAVHAGAYDLVLMDIQMPVMDGVAATRHIRGLPGKAGLPILALTANTLAEQLETYAAVGMNDCIAKPVNMIELLTKVMQWSAAAAEAASAAA